MRKVGCDSNIITTPETSRIVIMNSKRGWRSLSVPTRLSTLEKQCMEKKEMKEHTCEVISLDWKHNQGTTNTGVKRIGDQRWRMKDIENNLLNDDHPINSQSRLTHEHKTWEARIHEPPKDTKLEGIRRRISPNDMGSSEPKLLTRGESMEGAK
ncbi:unnamed protein product [Lactuca saligna]|uniref:Uncharacterized protein n=1 Tax=Lactuca saligna TaxID=75948 RepID=A0AA35ZKN6_LACSI|nr:unnamed protein product [Lactuca saligna]